MPDEPLLLLAPRVTDDSVAMWRAALAAGWHARRLTNWRAPEDLKHHTGSIVIYAEPLFAEVFEAKVYECGTELPSTGQIGNVLVLTSEPVNFVLEVRCFVSGAHVLTASPYWRNGELAQSSDGRWPFMADEEEQAFAFARDVLDYPEIGLPPSLALDIGITAEHGWAVVEANPSWGAGLYGCDPSEALRAIERAFVRRDSVGPDCLRWISRRNSGPSDS